MLRFLCSILGLFLLSCTETTVVEPEPTPFNVNLLAGKSAYRDIANRGLPSFEVTPQRVSTDFRIIYSFSDTTFTYKRYVLDWDRNLPLNMPKRDQALEPLFNDYISEGRYRITNCHDVHCLESDIHFRRTNGRGWDFLKGEWVPLPQSGWSSDIEVVFDVLYMDNDLFFIVNDEELKQLVRGGELDRLKAIE